MAKPRPTLHKKSLNQNFSAAKASKEDEFYTQLSDIEKELKHYAPHFKGKAVYCNCDDPRISNFFHYFSYNCHAALNEENAESLLSIGSPF